MFGISQKDMKWRTFKDLKTIRRLNFLKIFWTVSMCKTVKRLTNTHISIFLVQNFIFWTTYKILINFFPLKISEDLLTNEISRVKIFTKSRAGRDRSVPVPTEIAKTSQDTLYCVSKIFFGRFYMNIFWPFENIIKKFLT